MNIQTITKFHQTRIGYVVFGLAELISAIVFANLALDSGSLWQWILVVIIFVGFLQNFGRMVVHK